MRDSLLLGTYPETVLLYCPTPLALTAYDCDDETASSSLSALVNQQLRKLILRLDAIPFPRGSHHTTSTIVPSLFVSVSFALLPAPVFIEAKDVDEGRAEEDPHVPSIRQLQIKNLDEGLHRFRK